MSKGTILVTGGTGFLGAHLISQLLEKGYTVRATARSTSKLQSIFPKASPEQLEVVEAPTLTSDHSAALKGVDALIHSASPHLWPWCLGTGAFLREFIIGAYDGTVALVKQAIAAGVKKIIVTGTFATLFDSDFKSAFGTRVLTDKDFGSVTLESIDLNKDGMQVYQEAKTLADKKIWELAHEHPEVDFTVVLPPAIFGPQLSQLTSSPSSLSTNSFVQMLFAPEYPPIPIGHMIDVRDAARAHVLALTTPPVPGRDKRFIVLNSTFQWKDVAALIRNKRPELAGRLPKETSVPGPQTSAPLDTTFSEEVLGMTNYIPQEETFLAAVDVVLEWESKFGDK
ncbi:NAD(P)-binding protein [Gymnopus androsaceus JB14]|uniref:NAD(P)-binding protein n=1 Tax=Gymnopus androsaceus JB14 TaxID=1447944 RepID=A0A6A4GVW8_9AGAR|nr:NAD(P)-binding protein [Gymnopus androsaceus JB14]